MGHFSDKTYRKRRMFLLFLVLLYPALQLAVHLTTITAHAGTNADWQASLEKMIGGTVDEDEMTLAKGYYGLTDVAGNAFATAMSKNTVSEMFGSIPANGAGALISFCSENSQKFTLIPFISSYSSAEYNYSMLLDPEMEWNAPGRVFAPYLAMGAAFSDMGIDKTGLALGGSSLLRVVTGGIVFVIYQITRLVPVLFTIVVKFLKMINPFQFFYTTEGNLSAQYAALEGDHTATLFSSLTNFVHSWYRVLNNMGPFVVVFFTALLAASVLLNRRARSDVSTYKKWLIRIAFIVIGIPVIGSTYSVMLDELESMASGPNMAATKVVASSFCDFESFANNGMDYKGTLRVTVSPDGSISAAQGMNVQEVCLDINIRSNPEFGNGSWEIYSGSNMNSGSISSMVSNLQSSPVTGFIAEYEMSNWVSDVLLRYMKGEKISAEDFAGRSAGKMWLRGIGSATSDKKAAALSFLSKYGSVDGFEESNQSVFRYRVTDSDGNTYDVNPFSVGSGDNWCGPGFWPSMDGTGSDDRSTSVDYSQWDPTPLTIYNYLRSDFNSNKVTVYSSENASSNAVKSDHYSVNLVGRGAESIMILLTCISMLLIDVVLGIYYGLGIVMSNLRRGVQLILSVPVAMLGSLKAIARIITYAVVMILEVIASFLGYSLMTNLIYTLVTAFNSELESALRAAGIGLGAQPFALFGLFTIILNIWFLIMAVKLRKTLVRGMDQTAEAIISKFIMGEAQHTGALNSKESMPVKQLGEKPERTGMQKIGDATGRLAGAAVNGVMAAGLLASGNVAGGLSNIGKAVKGVKDAKDAVTDGEDGAKDGTEGLNEVQEEKPAGGRIESRGLKRLPGSRNPKDPVPAGGGPGGPGGSGPDGPGGDPPDGDNNDNNKMIPGEPAGNVSGVASRLNAGKGAMKNLPGPSGSGLAGGAVPKSFGPSGAGGSDGSTHITEHIDREIPGEVTGGTGQAGSGGPTTVTRTITEHQSGISGQDVPVQAPQTPAAAAPSASGGGGTGSDRTAGTAAVKITTPSGMEAQALAGGVNEAGINGSDAADDAQNVHATSVQADNRRNTTVVPVFGRRRKNRNPKPDYPDKYKK